MEISDIISTRYDPKSFEKEVYESSLDSFLPKPEKNLDNYFSILMPPPNVTGNLHLGHALTYTLQDILVRYHRQRGVDTFWQPGLDHAGISTQLVVEKWLEKQGIKASDLSYDEFIAKVWEWKASSATSIITQQKALGCSAPWKYSRFTMDEGFSKSVIDAFVQLYKDGLIYKAERLVNWDTKLETAISDLEIKNVEEAGSLWYINYKISDSDEFITVATTRPETMFGDVALAVNKNDERFKKLIGKYAVIPYTDRKIPIITDEHADMDKGSGCVKITPAHDFNDFEVGKRHNLGFISVLDKHGHMLNDELVPEFLRGVYLKKARKILLEHLTNDKLLIKTENIKHFVPYGEKSGTVIEPLITKQWFLDAPTLAGKAIEVVESGKVKFYPDKWKNTFFDWMKNIQPWCISRQIRWGHRIPAWYTPSGEIIVEKTEEEAIQKAKMLNVAPKDLRRETDVLDTWFSSGLWPFETMNSEFMKRFFPTTTLVTGFDIIFFWIARMMMLTLYFTKNIPFKDIYIHALVRDDKGQKMSKSKGNVIDPLELMNEFGADALRYTLTFLSVPGRDIKFGRDNVKISRNFITKIWNAGRFLQTQGIKFDVPFNQLNTDGKISQWILSKLIEFKNGIENDIKEYRFDYIAHRMQVFLRDQFCDFFIEAVKIQNDENTKNIAGFVYKEFLKLSNPVIPFVTEHLLDLLSHNTDLRPTDFSTLKINETDVKDVEDLVAWVHEVRGIKHAEGANSEKYVKSKNDTSKLNKSLKELFSLA